MLFFRKKEKRDADIAAAIKGGAYTVDTVTKDEALSLPAVGAAVDFIAGTIAGLPVRLFERTGDSVNERTDDARLAFLNRDTGDTLSAQQMLRAVVTDYLLDGAGYVYVERTGNRVKGLYYVPSQAVSVLEGSDKVKKDVQILINGVNYPEYSMLRVTRRSTNGVSGVGVLKQFPLLFSTMRGALRYENFCISSGTKRGFLKSAARLDKDRLAELREAWRRFNSTDANGSNDVIVLNNGISFEPASTSATENQLNESKRTNSDLVYAVFGLPAALFGTGGASSETYLSALRTGVLPVVEALNAAINKALLLEKEKGRYFFEIDTRDIMRQSIGERYAAYATALSAGFMQIDEVRTAENMEPLGLDFVKLSLADVFYYPKTGEIFTPNTATTAATDAAAPAKPAADGAADTGVDNNES